MTLLEPYKGVENEDTPADEVAFGRSLQEADAKLGRPFNHELAAMIADAEARQEAQAALG